MPLSIREGRLRFSPEIRLQAIPKFSIVARFLTRHPINIDAIANTFNPLWRPKIGFRMKFIGDHLILFSFDSKEDVNKILATAPWSFNKCIMDYQGTNLWHQSLQRTYK